MTTGYNNDPGRAAESFFNDRQVTGSYAMEVLLEAGDLEGRSGISGHDLLGTVGLDVYGDGSHPRQEFVLFQARPGALAVPFAHARFAAASRAVQLPVAQANAVTLMPAASFETLLALNAGLVAPGSAAMYPLLQLSHRRQLRVLQTNPGSFVLLGRDAAVNFGWPELMVDWVARRHCEIVVWGSGEVVIRDESGGGTYVRERRS